MAKEITKILYSDEVRDGQKRPKIIFYTFWGDVSFASYYI